MAKKQARTRKPCPGCGEGGQYAWRDADKVCNRCQKLLAEARAMRERDPKREVVQIPDYPYMFPYIHHGYRSSSEIDERETDLFQRFFHALIESIGQPGDGALSTGPLIKGSTGGHGGCWHYVSLPVETAEYLRMVYAGAVAMVSAGYENGQEAGRFLIGRLASGDATIEEFNKATLGQD